MSRTKQVKFGGASRIMTWFLIALLFTVSGARAASVDKEKATIFAENWLKVAGNALNTQVGAAAVGNVEEFKNAEGVVLGYIVSLEPKGYIVVSADDRINPVVMVSKDGAFDANPQNPLFALLYSDLSVRMEAAEKLAPVAKTRGAEVPEFIQENQARWDRFVNGPTRAAGIGVVSEVWVAPFVESRWSQSGGIYNYYTPTIYDKTYSFDEPGNQKNAPSGCVATGTAQILRYFQWPQKPIGVKTGSYSVETDNGTQFSGQMNLRGGDGTGGAYNWDAMTLVPTGAEKMETYKQIGALLFDAGLSVGMSYSTKGSGSNYSPSSMKRFFGYADAARSLNENDTRSNLDARRPVAVSISSILPEALGGEGHAIVCDGYGRMDGRWYYHMNYGWGGSADAWYNKEEVYNSAWTPAFGWAMGNLYRQKLQPNDNLAGQIISGRVTDANGNPVAGVKVSIRKKGSEDTWQTMLVWNEPNDPKATPIYQDWDEKGNNDGTQQDDEIPGADKFRNTTDAHGIWAIDKVGAGDYEIVLEKDGLNFSGTKAITVGSNRNIWANDFIASPLDNLALQSWWIKDGVVYLQFNRAVGNVNVDLSKAAIGGTRLSSGEAQVIASSDIIAITGVSASGNLTLQAGFLTVDVDGSNTTDQSGMYNVAPVVVLDVVEGMAAGSASATSKVTSITRKNNAETKDNLLVFTVKGNGLTDADLNSFKIRNITTGKKGTQVPNASIYSWNPATGELVVRAFNGEAYIGVDYVPETGSAYLSSELYTFDDCGPAIIAATLSKDNTYVTVTWNEPVHGWTKAVEATDLNVVLHNNGGTITNAQVDRVVLLDAVNGYAKQMNVFIKYTPSLEVQYNKAAATTSGNMPYTALNNPNWTADDDTIAAYRVPAGVESIEVVPRENKVFDALKNASATSNTTGDLLLFASNTPRLVSAVMSNDNYAIQLTFNKRIFGYSMLASPLMQLVAVNSGEMQFTQFLSNSNFAAVVNYSDGSTDTLNLNNNGIYYTIGTNYIYLDYNHYNGDAAGNRRKLDPVYNETANGKTPQSVTLTLRNIIDKDGNNLKDTRVTIPLWPKYAPGRTSLLPAMFTNARGSYTHIEQPNNQVLVTKAGTNNPDNYLYTPYGEGQCGVDPASDGLIYYGIYYRDLDGDGRIDAVDLNYHNPDYNNGNSPAQLYAGGSAASNFRVWIQNNDPDDIDDAEKNFYPADSEGPDWSSFPTAAPLGNGTADNAIFNFRNNYTGYTNFNKNWICITPSSAEVVSQNLLKSGGNNNNERYSTLRLRIDQSRVRARTYGTRFVMVSYSSPRDVTTYGGNGNANGKYNKYMVAGAKAPTNDTAPGIYARYNDSDETAGVYWRRPFTSTRSDANGTSGCMDNIHIADGFGPVVAWDGAAPVPVTATAWRATPYIKNGETNMDGYEYVDVTFTEPIAFAGDKAMSGCGYTSDPKEGVKSDNGYLHGAWGAEVISANTVRFKVNGVHASKSFSFNGALFGMTPGFFESYSDDGTRNPRSLSFSVNAIGIKPVDSRYKVVSQGSAVDMFTVDAADASITSYGTTFAQSVNTVELKSIEQGGDWRSTTANWLRNGTSLGGVGTSLRDTPNATSALTYSIRSNTLNNNVAPGSSVYGVISQLIIRNTTFFGYAVKGGAAEVHSPAADNTFYAPDPIFRNLAFIGPETPVRSVMSGPVYNMVKVGALTQPSGTSRIVAGRTVSVLGIDVAGAAAHKLTAVTVRAIDTSMGQFDPSIDLEPLADGATSGLQLFDANNNTVIKVANNGDEWSEWKVNEAGQPYKEVTLRPLTPVTLPTAGDEANSFNFQIRVITSASFNLGDSFVIEIPDDGIAFGSYKTVDNRPATWGTPNGAPGFPFTDYYYRDNNNDGRWAEGDSIASREDSLTTVPLYDGGRPYTTASNNRPILTENGVNIKNLYYAKKNWATNPESNPFFADGHLTNNDSSAFSSMMGGVNFIGTNTDLNYNVSYAPGDDVWYDIGGEPGVYDEGIDIPLFGNANAFPLSWQIAECGGKSGQYRAAATATAGSASTGFISAPSEGPVATVGLDMRDAGRGFGPRFILDDSILVESISKNIAGGEYSIILKNGKLVWNNGAEFAIPADNERAVIDDGNGTFIVVRKLADAAVPTADTTVNFTVSADAELDIQQPSTITGVRITALGRGNVANTKGTLKRNGTKLSWKGGAEVDVAAGGFFFLNGNAEDYLVVQVSQVGGGTSDELSIYSADGRSITPFLNISGLEIMTVSDMVPQGYYTFSYDGAGTLSWGNGAPAKVNVGQGEFVLVEGNGTNLDYAQNFVVVRRTNGPLPAQACTDTLFINQSQLLRVAVTVTGVNGFSITHLADLTNDENSGVSLWWDANADGTFNTGDKFVKLLETPVFSTNGDAYSTVLTPDPQFITSWLSCSQSVSDTSFNFFVCVNTTEDMSYGDSFNVSAQFYEPTEPNYTSGGNYFASANSGNIVCTSITNTVFKKKTTKGQTIDSNTTVRLASINHFFGTAISGKSVYMTAVTITIVAPEGSTFHPDTAFTPMDAASAANRGIQLVAANGNVIPCAIELITDNPEKGPWTYVLRPESSGGDSAVPQAQDDVEDHFIDVKLANTLPYGVSFYARMETDAVVYNTGKGSAAAAMVTDILGSTINSEYADLLDSSMVTPTSGLVVNSVGTGVASAYHDIKIGYNVGANTYYLTWNGNNVSIDATQPGTYILGSGTNSITVTFDPAAFFMEDTLVTSESGRPDADITIGTKLTNLAGQGLKYYDANANGQYDLYEPIACNGELIYGNGDVALCVVEITAASGLSFWDKDGDGAYAKGDSIFHDTDNEYTLPWMALLIDSDNYITAGQGGAASGISSSTSLVDATTVSPEFDAPLSKGLYLYYIDTVADGRGYVYGEDIIIARTVTTDDTMTAAILQKDASKVYYDKVVFDPAYGKEDYEEIAAGALNCFDTMDYVKFRQGGNDPAAFEQGDSIFLSVADVFASPDFTWTIRVNKDRRIRWYSETAPAPYNEALKSITAIAGLDIASSGATDVVLTSLTVRFVNVSNFTMDDLRSLTTDENSGVQLWRDLDGNGIFNPDIDKLVKLSSAPTLSSDATNYIVKFSPSADNEITNADVDGIYDFFVVVQPSITANNKQKVDNGDSFRVVINNNDVVLNKTLNKSASLTSGTITIDSRFPALASTPVITDADSDGYLDSVTLVFDEKLRPGMLDDVSIWQLRDNTNGNALTVTKATLSGDYKTVTLTLSDADIGSTTGKVSLVVIYNGSESALLDWAGNAVDFRIDATRPENADDYTNYTATSDTVAPQIVHAGLKIADAEYDETTVVKATGFYFHDRNANGVWDNGEDIWTGDDTYKCDIKTRIWNGGDNAWTTDYGYKGVELTNAYFCDANGDGAWNGFEFLWIDDAETYEAVEEGEADTVVEGVFVEGNDTIVPLYRTEEIDVFDKDHNGHVDALRVYFSENVNDSTMTGYVGSADSYTASKWSVTGGRTLTAWRLGLKDEDITDIDLKSKIIKDSINNNCMYFTFAENASGYDTNGDLTLSVAAGETLKDLNGNVLNKGAAYAIKTNDRAKPVLLAAESDTRVDKYGVLAEGSKLILTFSEPMGIFYTVDDIAAKLNEVLIKKNETWMAFDASLASAVEVSEEDASKIVITMAESDGWSYKTAAVKIREDIDTYAEDTVFGDASGNNLTLNANLAECPVTGIVYKEEPAIEIPVAYNVEDNNILRSDDLKVKIYFGSYGYNLTEDVFANAFQVAEWTLTVTHNGTVISQKGFSDEESITGLAKTEKGFLVFTDREWLFEGGFKVLDYVLSLDATAVDPDTNETFPVHAVAAFKAQADICADYTDIGDGKVVSADDGLVLNKVGESVPNGYSDVKLKLVDGVYTLEWNGYSVVIEDITKVTTVTLGDEANRIQVTLNPNAFSNELNEKITAGEDFTTAWTILIDQERKINVFNAKAPAPYNVVGKALSAVAGLDIANSGEENVGLKSVTVHFVSEQDFSMDALCGLSTDGKSGVQLWRDANGNSVFDENDARVALSSAVVEDEGEGSYKVVLTLTNADPIVNETVDGLYDYYVVVLPKAAVEKTNEGPQFKVVISQGEIILTNKEIKHTELVSEPFMIDSKAPALVESSIADTDGDGYLEKVELVFDEQLRRDAVDDIAIWQLKDASNGNALTVINAELDETCTKVTLTLAGDDLGTTTGAVSLMVAYGDGSALLDWAGNAVDFRTDETKKEGAYANYTVTADTAAPVVLHAEVSTGENTRSEKLAVLDKNCNGHIDAIDVFFSEPIDPATLENAVWTLEGYGALTAEIDAENASHVCFTFAEGDAYDTAAKPALVIDDIITDLAGNAVAAPQGLVLSDCAAPVLVYAKAEGGKIADDTMPEGVTITLTFSEPVEQYLVTDEESTVEQIMTDFQIRRNGKDWETINDTLVSAVAVENGKIVLTMTAESTGWGLGNTIDIKVREDIAATVFGDAAGNSIIANRSVLYPYEDEEDANIAFVHTIIEFQDAVILNPNADNNYLRTDVLPVQLELNSANANSAFQVAAWTFTVEHDGEQTATIDVDATPANAAALAKEGGMAVFADNSWQIENGAAPAAYTLKVSFTWIDPDDDNAETNKHFVEYSTSFTALANKGVEPMEVRDGMIFGENITEIQKNASNVWSNWTWGETNITNDNKLIAAYKSYYIDATGNAVSAVTEKAEAGAEGEYVAKMLLNDYLEVGQSYVAVVEAYDADGDMIAKGVSDGVTVVEAFDDVESMEFTDGTDLTVDHTDKHFNTLTILRTDSHDTLYAKWTPVSDALTSKENMRYMYRVVSQFGSSQWSVDAGTMNQPRQDFGSAVIGDKLYAIGGYQDGVLSSVEVYDLATRKWSEAASLNEARRGFACLKVSDSQIAVIGGTGEGDTPLTSIELFDGAKWTKLPVSLPEAYDSVKAVKVDDTHVWIVGSAWYKDETRQSVLKTEIRKFDISTMTFDGDVIAAPAITARYDDFQVVLQRRADGANLVIADGLDADYCICRKVDVVDIATGAVSTVETTDSRWGCAMIAVPSVEDTAVDNVWFIGGMDDYFEYLTSVDQLDATGTIATLDGKLNIGRAGASVYWNEDLGNVIVVGGYTSDHAWKNIPEIAANDGEKWIQCPGTAMNVARIGQHLEVVGSDLNEKRMVLFGGIDQNNYFIAETESCIWIETLEASEWKITNDTKTMADGLSLKEGASYVFEVKAVDEQGYESAAARSAGIYVSSSSIQLELVPAPVVNAAEGQCFGLKVTGKNDSDTIKYYHYKVMVGDEVFTYSAESVDIATVTTLPAFYCADGENATTYDITVWSAIDASIFETASVTIAKATYMDEEGNALVSVDPLDVDSYTLGVSLNGLVAYEWQLDDGDVSDVSTASTFTVTGLAVGSHTVSLWGIDENGVRQSDATTITLFYKTPAIVGDVLTGVITPDKDEVGDSDTVTYTLTMSEAIVNDPVADNFTVENGVIESIEDVDGNKTTYTITVKPVGDGFVTITLKANTLFTADKGIPNAASEAGKTLYYTKPVLTFTPVVVDGLNEDEIAFVGRQIKVDITFESDYALMGGDLGIMFDSEVFDLADVTDGEPDPTKMLAAEYQLFNAEKGKAGYVASWIKEDGKIVGIRLGGAKISDAPSATAATYATITFNVLKEVTEGSAIALAPLNNEDEYAGLALQGLGHLEGELLSAVNYGEVIVKTALERPTLTLSAASAVVEEGTDVELTIALDYALETAVDVELAENGAVLGKQTIKAGDTTVTVKLDKQDEWLTGDRVFEYEIACTDDAVILGNATATVTVTDDDTAITMTPEVASINEGAQMTITFALADGIKAADDVTFNSPLIPTTDPDDGSIVSGINFRLDAEPVIKAGENSGSIIIKTYNDNVKKDDYKIIVTLTEMNVGANVCSAFAETSVFFTVNDTNSKAGDFNGDDIVDYHDVLEFLAAMGATSEDADWADNVMYDLNGDDVVDYHDLIELLSLMEVVSTRTRSESQNMLRMWLEADKATVKPGDVVTIKLMVENLSGKAFCGFGCNVNFNAADLKYNGDFIIDDIMDRTVFSIQAGGELAENGIANLNGGCMPGSIATDEEPCELAVMSFKVQNTAAGNISIDLNNIDATVSGAIVRKGQLEVECESLTITVEGGAAVVPAFDIEFEAHQQTRAANVALKVGMADGASYQYNAEEGDLPAFDPIANVYDIRIIDGRRGEDDLMYDIRGLANRETWNVKVTVFKDQTLTLDWSAVELPEYFDFTIVKGKSHFDEETVNMRETTSMTFEEGEFFFTIVADKVKTADDEFTFTLNEGWNLIGIPFVMDEASLAKFDGIVFAYDVDANAYVQYDAAAMNAGVSYWVFADEAQTITVKASGDTPDGVAVKAGWNFVAPLKGAELVIPDVPIRAIWFYTQDGYRQVEPNDEILLGRGYWIYSDTDTVIWKTK